MNKHYQVSYIRLDDTQENPTEYLALETDDLQEAYDKFVELANNDIDIAFANLYDAKQDLILFDTNDNRRFSEEDIKQCDWCYDVFPVNELTKTDLGCLCDTCIEAIKSRGEEVIMYEEFDDPKYIHSYEVVFLDSDKQVIDNKSVFFNNAEDAVDYAKMKNADLVTDWFFKEGDTTPKYSESVWEKEEEITEAMSPEETSFKDKVIALFKHSAKEALIDTLNNLDIQLTDDIDIDVAIDKNKATLIINKKLSDNDTFELISDILEEDFVESKVKRYYKPALNEEVKIEEDGYKIFDTEAEMTEEEWKHFDFIEDAKRFFAGKPSQFAYPDYDDIAEAIYNDYSGALLSKGYRGSFSRPNGDPGDPPEAPEYDIPNDLGDEWQDNFKKLFYKMNQDLSMDFEDLMDYVDEHYLSGCIFADKWPEKGKEGPARPDDDDLYRFFDIDPNDNWR